MPFLKRSYQSIQDLLESFRRKLAFWYTSTTELEVLKRQPIITSLLVTKPSESKLVLMHVIEGWNRSRNYMDFQQISLPDKILMISIVENIWLSILKNKYPVFSNQKLTICISQPKLHLHSRIPKIMSQLKQSLCILSCWQVYLPVVVKKPSSLFPNNYYC